VGVAGGGQHSSWKTGQSSPWQGPGQHGSGTTQSTPSHLHGGGRSSLGVGATPLHSSGGGGGQSSTVHYGGGVQQSPSHFGGSATTVATTRAKIRQTFIMFYLKSIVILSYFGWF
jgi:hypothetical protein